MSIAASSRELMAWICELEDVDPFPLADVEDLLAHAREKGLISNADTEAVQQRVVDLVDRGMLGATDPLGGIDQPVPAADRARGMSELRTTTAGRQWAEAGGRAELPTQAEVTPREIRRKVAVMHGRDLAARDAIVAFLRKLGLDPLEWEDLVKLTESASPYNGDAVAAAFDGAQAVVVLLTPDEVGFLHPALHAEHEREDDRQPTGQPRLNVVLEAGMAFQADPRRTVLVEIGRTREISDLAGRNAVRLDGTPQKLNSFANRLEVAGCPVSRTGNDWLDATDIAALDALTREPTVIVEQARGGQTLDELQADERSTAVRRAARQLLVELSTIDRTLELALESGHLWNVAFEGLPAIQWEAVSDLVASEVPRLHDAVYPSYVEADQLNKAANNHAQGGHDEYDETIRTRMESLREEIIRAKAAINEHAPAG